MLVAADSAQSHRSPPSILLSAEIGATGPGAACWGKRYILIISTIPKNIGPRRSLGINTMRHGPVLDYGPTPKSVATRGILVTPTTTCRTSSFPVQDPDTYPSNLGLANRTRSRMWARCVADGFRTGNQRGRNSRIIDRRCRYDDGLLSPASCGRRYASQPAAGSRRSRRLATLESSL